MFFQREKQQQAEHTGRKDFARADGGKQKPDGIRHIHIAIADDERDDERIA